DSKDPRDKPFLADAPKIDAFLSDEAQAFFAAVTSGLDAAGVKWVRAESLVRGLDYYRHTAFEFIPDEGSASAAALGSQSTVLGGGRYDGLMESLGGAATPAVGWAAGIERLAMLVGARVAVDETEVVAFTELTELEDLTWEIVFALRRGGEQHRSVHAEAIVSGSPKKRYAKAKASGASRGLSIEGLGGVLGVARLRDLNASKAKPVRNRISEALATRFKFEETEIENAYSWILVSRI
ncbi:MAG: ATP phosphoribosyltransferase regulatory subunit, partial [Erythrobacter sp.]|nr:ATP phosphoribosyltransferase regulatory subunit [Erythrobacter sp.]